MMLVRSTISDTVYRVFVNKASAIGNETVRTLTIQAVDPISAENLNLDQLRALYALQAQLFVDGILSCLPIGLTDAILAELMRRKATVLAIPSINRERRLQDDQAKENADKHAAMQTLEEKEHDDV